MHRSLRLAALVPFLLAGGALAGDLEDARALQQAGRFEEALPKYQAAAKADPTGAEAALGLSQVLAGLGRYDEAAKAVDAARKAHPENAALLAAKGRAFLLCAVKAEGAEEPDATLVDAMNADAVRWAEEAVKVDPKNVEALLLRGQLHQKAGEGDAALALFEQAAAADPKSFDAAFEVANHWYLQAGANKKDMALWAKAEAGFERAAALDPKSARAATNLAHCKAWQRKSGKEVAAAYLRAAELAPSDEGLLKNLLNWTPADERVATFQKLADAAPKDVLRHIWLGKALVKDRNFAKASQALEDASKVDPKNPYVPIAEGDAKLAEGKDLDKAIEFYVEALTLFKTRGSIDDAAYRYLAGTVAFESRSLSEDQRETLWTALTKLFPDRSEAANNAGLWFRDAAKKYDKSLEWYEKGVKISPEDVCLLNDTGLIHHYHMNQFDKAEPYYRRAIAAGKKLNYDCNLATDPDRGFRDAINNLHLVLVAQERWADLKKFVLDDVPASHPLRDRWLQQAEEKKK